MIVAATDGQLLAVTQNDHAHLAGEILSLWREGGMPDHPRRRELLFAAREHDNGWAEIDSAPMCDRGEGRPIDFMAVPAQTRWDVWRRGTRRHAEREPYAALLIVRHALHLHRSQSEDPEWSDVFAEWHQLEAELMEVAGVAEEEVERDYRWIELTDVLSLAACNRGPRAIDACGTRGELVVSDDVEAGSTLGLDPFPLAGATTFHAACRLIPDRRYAGDADLGVELAAARWRRYPVRIAPLPAAARRGFLPGIDTGVEREEERL